MGVDFSHPRLSSMVCQTTTARHMPSGKTNRDQALAALRCGRAVLGHCVAICPMSANLVHVTVGRLVAVRAALQRSVLKRQRAAAVHRRVAVVHEREGGCIRRNWGGDTKTSERDSANSIPARTAAFWLSEGAFVRTRVTNGAGVREGDSQDACRALVARHAGSQNATKGPV
jgi:hypothetical protein